MLRGAVQRVRLERVQAHHAGRDDHAALARGTAVCSVRAGGVPREGDEELQPADHGVEVHVEGLEVWRHDAQLLCCCGGGRCCSVGGVGAGRGGRRRDFGGEDVLAVINARVRGEDVDAVVVGVRALEEGQLRGEGGDVRGDEGRGRGGGGGEGEGGRGMGAGRVDVGHEDLVVLGEEVRG